MDLHQISRFLSADEYERLIFNHRRLFFYFKRLIYLLFFVKGIRNLLEELGCSTSSNGFHDQSSQSSIFLFFILYFINSFVL